MYSRGLHALHDLSLTVAQGEFVFDRPSGAGKSTLLRLLLMQERPTGDLVNGQTLAKPAAPRGAGVLAQHRVHLSDFKLIPTRTVVENVSFVPEVMGTRVPAAAPRISGAEVGRAATSAERVSIGFVGGEQQRVAIARALVNGPSLVSPTNRRGTSIRTCRSKS